MAKLAKINLHQPKASREQYIQSPLFRYSWTRGGKILFVWYGMCFCTKAILAWCFEKLSQAHHCLILGNWARLNFLRSHARLTLVTPSPYHTADNSAVTSSIIRAPGVTEKTTATSKFYSYPFPSLTLVFLLPCFLTTGARWKKRWQRGLGSRLFSLQSLLISHVNFSAVD